MSSNVYPNCATSFLALCAPAIWSGKGQCNSVSGTNEYILSSTSSPFLQNSTSFTADTSKVVFLTTSRLALKFSCLPIFLRPFCIYTSDVDRNLAFLPFPTHLSPLPSLNTLLAYFFLSQNFSSTSVWVRHISTYKRNCSREMFAATSSTKRLQTQTRRLIKIWN